MKKTNVIENLISSLVENFPSVDLTFDINEDEEYTKINIIGKNTKEWRLPFSNYDVISINFIQEEVIKFIDILNFLKENAAVTPEEKVAINIDFTKIIDTEAFFTKIDEDKFELTWIEPGKEELKVVFGENYPYWVKRLDWLSDHAHDDTFGITVDDETHVKNETKKIKEKVFANNIEFTTNTINSFLKKQKLRMHLTKLKENAISITNMISQKSKNEEVDNSKSNLR